MTWTIYLSSVVGFRAASTMYFLDEFGDDADDWLVLLIVVPLLSFVWPLLILPLIIINSLNKLNRKVSNGIQ